MEDYTEVNKMLEAVAIAIGIQVAVNWITVALSPTQPVEQTEIEIEVNADDLVCSKDEQFVIESKVLGGKYYIDNFQVLDILENNEYNIPRVDEITTPDTPNPSSKEPVQTPEPTQPSLLDDKLNLIGGNPHDV